MTWIFQLRSQAASLGWMSPCWKIPALEKKTSTRAKRASASRTRRWTSASLLTSHCTASPPVSAATGFSFSEDKSARTRPAAPRSEEHTSELQSHVNLVCRLLLEKKKKQELVRNNT